MTVNYTFDTHYKTLSENYNTQNETNLTLARVMAQYKGMYLIATEEKTMNAVISGKMRFDAIYPQDMPAVGDFVMADDSDDTTAVIHCILERKTTFIRKAAGTSANSQLIATNVDTVFICMSLGEDFNIRRLERYLSVMNQSGSESVIVLTKADTAEDLNFRLSELSHISKKYPVVISSAYDETGFDELKKYIRPGKTIAFTGSSGVGKSTLINKLLGEDIQKTNGLRDDEKGRHTTTTREIFSLPDGAYLIDTPGMREMGMWTDSQGLEEVFSDIEELISSCRFSDCSHTVEKGCAIIGAIKSGELDKTRWDNYLRLNKEISYARNSEDYLAKKEQWRKDISKRNKAMKKNKNRY